MSQHEYTITWHDGVQDIEIRILHTPLKWNVISHLEIQSIKPKRCALPITGTGYLSHHFAPESVDLAETTITELVTDWLNEEAQKPHWQRHLERSRQYALF